MNQPSYYPIIGKTFSGLENILAEEVEKYGAKKIELLTRGVKFLGNDAILYNVNYCCRTALRFLKPIHSFSAKNENELYHAVRKIRWDSYLSLADTFSVDPSGSSQIFRHSHYIALKVKDAIVDQFRDRYGKRPSVDTDNPVLRINVHVYNEQFTISLDSSGTSLHQRGYRTATVAAPLSEVLAAGLVMLSGWDKKCAFIDPMCGSGTIPIEAACIARNIPAGKYRKNYGFQKWQDFNRNIWDQVKNKADANIVTECPPIMASDISLKAIRSTRENIRQTDLSPNIRVMKKSFDELVSPARAGIIITNPPYGERLKPENIAELYRDIGNQLKNKFTGFEAWIISSHLDALKFVGLKPSRKIKVFNGQLECRFVKFELYEGSRKSSKQGPGN